MRIFLSYSWKDKELADEIDKAFLLRNIQVVRDVRDLNYKQNIKVFMQQIGQTDFAMLLISDSFLKSANCMYEVLELLQAPKFDNRVLPIITQDANIYSPEGKSNYIEYWQNKLDSVEGVLRSQKSISDSNSITDDLNHYKKIRNSIDEFIGFLNNHLHHSVDEIQRLEYSPILKYIGEGKKKALTETHLWGHPIGLYTLSLISFWERFGYYGMRSILVLFMVSSGISAGLDLPDREALEIYRDFTIAISIFGVIGGVSADMFLGQRRSLILGIMLTTIGYLFLAYNAESNLTIGLMIVAIGAGFFRPSVYSMIGNLYSEGDYLRHQGYSIFYVQISVAAFLGSLLVSQIAEYFGWSYGFIFSGLTIFISFCVVIWRRSNLIEEDQIFNSPKDKKPYLKRILTLNLAKTFFLLILALVLWNTIEITQSKSIIVRFNHPFKNLDYLFYVIAPITIIAWSRYNRKKRQNYSLRMFGIGFIILGLAHLSLILMNTDYGNYWIIIYTIFYMFAEMSIAPTILCNLSIDAPERYKSTSMAAYLGVFPLSAGLSAFLMGTDETDFRIISNSDLIATCIPTLTGILILIFHLTKTEKSLTNAKNP